MTWMPFSSMPLGAGHTLKEYGQILADDAEYRELAQAFSQRVKDVQEFLAQIDLGCPCIRWQTNP
jgi:glycolate oxidase iron-sulfur subunit